MIDCALMPIVSSSHAKEHEGFLRIARFRKVKPLTSNDGGTPSVIINPPLLARWA
jgi:hypothetical protein